MAERTQYSTRIRLPQTSSNRAIASDIDPLIKAIFYLAESLDRAVGLYPQGAADYSELGYSQILSGSQNKFYAVCAAAIPLNSFVSFQPDAGTSVEAVLAQANTTGTFPARAVNATANYALGDWGEFVMSPVVLTGFAGLTRGATYYLSTAVAGSIQLIRPVGAAEFQQQVGFAINATTLLASPFSTFLTNNT